MDAILDKALPFLHKGPPDSPDTGPGLSPVGGPLSGASPETAEEALEKAASMKELGLLDQAAALYGRLLGMDAPLVTVVSELVSCLTVHHKPEGIVQQIHEFLDGQATDPKKKAQIQLLLGLELEKGGHKGQAYRVFEEVSRTYPANQQIREKLVSLKGSLLSASRYDHLLQKGLVTQDQLQRAQAFSKKMKKSVEYVLIEQMKISREEVGKSLSQFYGCPFRSYDPKHPVPVELIRSLKKAFLLHDLWVPLSWGKQGVEILVDDPMDLRKTGQIGGLLKTRKIHFAVGIREDIQQFILHFFERRIEKGEDEMLQALDLIPDVEFEEEDAAEEFEEGLMDEESSQVVRLVDQFIITAYRKNASDIHVEPSPITNKTGIRMRLDGVCQEYLQVPNTMARGILSRLKIMAGLDIAERRLPQDGKIKFKRKDMPSFELRIATLPTAGGHEDAVLRVLAKAGVISLEEMALTERNIRLLRTMIRQPYGLILVAGPTGSGKTTMLHACVGAINNPGIKIWTAEDPVEITQVGLRQVEVKPKIGLDFARVMRSFLRADPDVIMIGEMRDFETASIGIEASLTGHLVFSTLHTNSAPETVTRLLDMGLNPLNFSDSLLAIVAQRLVRRLCTACRKAYRLGEEEFDELRKEYGEEAFGRTGITGLEDLVLYKPGSCEACSGTGYKGRMSIHEVLEGSPAIKRLIKKQGTSEDIFRVTTEEGMTTLKQDGILKVFKGFTDISEIRRVCIT